MGTGSKDILLMGIKKNNIYPHPVGEITDYLVSSVETSSSRSS